MSTISIIEFEGKTIYFADHKGSQGQDVVQAQEEFLASIKKSGSTEVLNITDMTGVFATPEVHKEMKRIGEEILKFSKKVAVIGMTDGTKKILINAFIRVASKPMKLFDDVEAAKAWLVAE